MGYYPPIEGLYEDLNLDAFRLALEYDHRHASDYKRLGVLLYDLSSTNYLFPLRRRASEERYIVDHLKNKLFSKPYWKFYDDKRSLTSEIYKSATKLCDALYCQQEDLPRYLGSVDSAISIIASWRLREQTIIS